MTCNLCPRKCNIDRKKSSGVCKMNDKMVVRKVMLHQYEEPILTSPNNSGSGTIFFAGCNLQCVYCQNYDVSHSNKGLAISSQELVDIFKKLESAGAGNIDLVTPTHFASQIIEALKIYKPQIPVIWNTSGYESADTIKKLEGLVDIYLTDFKYATNDLALRYSKANNYVENAKEALKEMKNQIKHNLFNNGKLIKGIIVRHMVLPNNTTDSKMVLDIINNILGSSAIISLMSQYTPFNIDDKFSEINRTITNLEYKVVVSYAKKLKLNNTFIQELESANKSYTPKFDNNIIEI